MNPDYLKIAERIGARVCRDAIWSGGRCNWTSDFLDGETIGHGALGPDLYDGSSGIALFLSRLATATGERIFRVTAEAAIRQALDKLPVPGCGIYEGGLGILYAASEIVGTLDREALLRQAIPDREKLDIIGGSAGAIPVLLSLGLAEAAAAHGDLLIGEACRTEHGWSWKTISAAQNLTGFSHGCSGIAWALLELYNATGEPRFRDAALEGLRYERHCFNSNEQNWPDFRDEQTAYPISWCHGAAGIALARLRAWQILRDETLLTEARLALRKVAEVTPSLDNFSLCHGRAGNADVLLYASQVLQEESWQREAEHVARAGIEQFEQRRIHWPCGLPGANETPDLMLGLAGIGYFYLRLADPAKTPPVTLIAQPMG